MPNPIIVETNMRIILIELIKITVIKERNKEIPTTLNNGILISKVFPQYLGLLEPKYDHHTNSTVMVTLEFSLT